VPSITFGGSKVYLATASLLASIGPCSFCAVIAASVSSIIFCCSGIAAVLVSIFACKSAI